MSQLQTEFEFTLPQGYVDDEGNLHKEGRMRLATAADEISPLDDPRVQQNSSYLTIILLSRVVTQLGDLNAITTDVIEDLFVGDLEYLQALYERVNNRGANVVDTTCPECGERFEVAADSGAVTDTSPVSSGGEPAEGMDLPEMEGVGGGGMEGGGMEGGGMEDGGMEGGGMDVPDHSHDVEGGSGNRRE